MKSNLHSSYMSWGAFFGTASFIVGSQLCLAGTLDDLNKADQEVVRSRQQLAKFFPTDASAWPEGVIYQYIDTTPEEAAAIFYDFGLEPEYLQKEGVRKVWVDPRGADQKVSSVNYEIDVPIVGSTAYTMLNHLSTYEVSANDDQAAGTAYKFDWVSTKTNTWHIKSVKGSVVFEPFQKSGGTLMVYRNLVVPGSLVPTGGLFGGKPKAQAKASLMAVTQRIVSYSKEEKVNNHTLLETQVNTLRGALK